LLELCRNPIRMLPYVPIPNHGKQLMFVDFIAASQFDCYSLFSIKLWSSNTLNQVGGDGALEVPSGVRRAALKFTQDKSK
jgi:hypothetical protein